MEFKAKQTRISGWSWNVLLIIVWLFLSALNGYMSWSRYQLQIELGYGTDNLQIYILSFHVIVSILFLVVFIFKLKELQKVKNNFKEITINDNEIILPDNQIIELSDITEALITGFANERISVYLKNSKRLIYINNCYNESLETIVKEIQNRVAIE